MCNSRIRKAPLGLKGMAVKLNVVKIPMAAKGITNMKELVKIQSNVINICCSRTKWKMFVRMAFTLSSILMGRELIVYGRKVKLLDDEVNRLVVILNQAWKGKASNTTVLCKTKTQKYKTVTVPENEEQDIPEDNMEEAALSDYGSISTVEDTGGPTILIPSPPPEKPHEDEAGVNGRAGDWPASLELPTQLSSNHLPSTTFSSLSSTVPSTAQNRNILNMLTSAKSVLEEHDDDDDEEVIIIKKEPLLHPKGRELIFCGRKVKLLDDEVNRLVVKLNQAWKDKASNTTVLCKTKSQKYKTVTVPENEEQDIPEDNMEEAALSDYGSISTVEDTGGPTILIPSPPPPEKPHEDEAGVNGRAGDWPASLERPTQLSSNHIPSTTSFSSPLSSVPSTAQNHSFLNMLTSAKSVLEEHDDDDDDYEEEDIIIKKEPSPHPKGPFALKVDGRSTDQKPSTLRSKHSATEQRRRSKTNDSEDPDIIMEASKEASGATHHQQNQHQQHAPQPPHASSRPPPFEDFSDNARPWIKDLDNWQPPQGFGPLAEPIYPNEAPQFKLQFFIEDGVAVGVHYLLLVKEDTFLKNPMIYNHDTVMAIPQILEAMPQGRFFIIKEFKKHGLWTTMDCIEYNRLKVKLFLWLADQITAAFRASRNGRRLNPSDLIAELGFGVSLQTKLRDWNPVVDFRAPAKLQRIVTACDFYLSADLKIIDSDNINIPPIRDEEVTINEGDFSFWLK